MVYWFTTEVEPMCDKGYLLRYLLRKIEGWESTYSGSEDLWWQGLTMPYWQWGQGDKGVSCEGLLPRLGQGSMLRRVTSKMRTRDVRLWLELRYIWVRPSWGYKWVSSHIYSKSTIGVDGGSVRMMSHKYGKYETEWSKCGKKRKESMWIITGILIISW